MEFPLIDPLDDKYRWCIYCSADCWLEPENQQHAQTCPTVTGVYPVRAEDLQPYGMDCSACHVPFQVGDTYTLINAETDTVTEPSPATGYIACLGCAALGRSAVDIT